LSHIWNYEKKPLNGGAGGEAFRIVFNGAGMEPAAMLAREAIQNSVDAALNRQGEVGVVFELRELHGEEREHFEKAVALSDLRERAELLELPAGNALERQDSPLNLLYISDYQTTGLCGDPTAEDSKLRKLLMEIGGSEKIGEGEHSGGSYGFGKAVYGGSSRIATIVVYSRTTDDKDEPLSVLMGCTYHVGHELHERKTTGRGFFGLTFEVEGEGLRYDPFLNEEADALAERLGMKREPDELGTTILIIDTPFQMSALKKGVEDNWWPRLEQNLLDVELIDFDGTSITPAPKQREDLAPFIEAFNVVIGVSPPIPEKSYKKEFNRAGGVAKGKIGLYVMPEREDAEEEYDADLRDSIVLIRSPLMVVQHFGKRTIGVPPLAGAFVADDEADPILRRSEPPEHNRWDMTAQRLDPDKQEPEFVRTILDGCWRELKNFQKRARPTEAKKPKRLSKIERTMSRWFGSSSTLRPPGPIPHDPTPISVEGSPHVEVVDPDRLRLVGGVDLSLNDNTDLDELLVAVDLKASFVEEESVSEADSVALSPKTNDDLFYRNDLLVARVRRGAKTKVRFSSDPYDSGWTVMFKPEFTPFEEGEAA